MKVETEIVWTQRFELDCALYGVSEKLLDRVKRNLAEDPGLGKPVDGGLLFEVETGGFVVRYSVVPDFSKIILLQLGPIEEDRPQVSRGFIAYLKDLAIYLSKQGVRKWLGL